MTASQISPNWGSGVSVSLLCAITFWPTGDGRPPLWTSQACYQIDLSGWATYKGPRALSDLGGQGGEQAVIDFHTPSRETRAVF